jgi:hypothetical protein
MLTTQPPNEPEDKPAFDPLTRLPSLISGVQLQAADFGLPGETQLFFVAHLPTGEHLRLTERAYDIICLLQQADPTLTYRQAAHMLSHTWHRPVHPHSLQQLIYSVIAPYGLLADHPCTIRSRSRNGLRLRLPFIPKRVVVALAKQLTWLYQPIFAIGASIAACVVLLVSAGQFLALEKTATSETFAGATILYLFSILVHEFGHATACRRFGASPGEIGFGLYLIYPAFYTSLTEAWRLPRKQRAVVDLGGIYFQSLLTLILYGLFAITKQAGYLLSIAFIAGTITFSLNPFLRLDGYWMLNDLLGLTALDRFQRGMSKAVLRGIKQGRGRPSRIYQQVRKELRLCIPTTTPAWVTILLLFYGVITNAFWCWFLFALGTWCIVFLNTLPDQTGKAISLLQQHHWMPSLSLGCSLLFSGLILFGMISMLLHSGCRLLRRITSCAKKQ